MMYVYKRALSLTNIRHFEYDFEFHSFSEFAKIKEKQKAWKVDNGLRVHEVTKSDQSPYVKHTAVQI